MLVVIMHAIICKLNVENALQQTLLIAGLAQLHEPLEDVHHHAHCSTTAHLQLFSFVRAFAT